MCDRLVGGLSLRDVSGPCTNSLAHGPVGGIQAQGLSRRPMQAWVSCSWGRTTVCDPHALGSSQCGEQRGPDLKHSETKGNSGQWYPAIGVPRLQHLSSEARECCRREFTSAPSAHKWLYVDAINVIVSETILGRLERSAGASRKKGDLSPLLCASKTVSRCLRVVSLVCCAHSWCSLCACASPFFTRSRQKKQEKQDRTTRNM